MTNRMPIMIAAMVVSLWFTSTLMAQTDPFYKGKTMRIVSGHSIGGDYDRVARLISRYIGKYIPGNPEVIVQNMPGAGTAIAGNYVSGVAKLDGLTLFASHNNLYLNQLAEHKEVKFDLRKFNWIGAAQKDTMLVFMRTDAPYKSIGDMVRAQDAPRCGSTGVGSSDYVMSRILEETTGAKINNVLGYPGSSEIAIALERGEVICMGLTLSSYFIREPFLSWQKQSFVRFLAQSGQKRDSRVPDAPTIFEIMAEYKTPATTRRVAEAMVLGGEWSRPLLAPAGTPQDRVQTLREAYDKAVNDPELVAEAKKIRLDIEPSRGEDLQLLAKKVMEQPPEVIERIKKLFVQ
jgi:tripartite-type tricarboxylate transporter receptor subunit TctC